MSNCGRTVSGSATSSKRQDLVDLKMAKLTKNYEQRGQRDERAARRTLETGRREAKEKAEELRLEARRKAEEAQRMAEVAEMEADRKAKEMMRDVDALSERWKIS